MRKETTQDKESLIKIDKTLRICFKELQGVCYGLDSVDSKKYQTIKDSILKTILKIEELKIRGLLDE